MASKLAAPSSPPARERARTRLSQASSMSIEWKKSVALVRRLSFGLWKSRDRGDRGSCLGVKVKLRPQKRWRPLTRVVRNSAWEHLLLKYQAIISAAKTEPEWKVQPALNPSHILHLAHSLTSAHRS